MPYSGHTRGVGHGHTSIGLQRMATLLEPGLQGHSISRFQEKTEILEILNQIASPILIPIPGGDLVLLPEPPGDFVFFVGVMGLVVIQNLRTRQDELQP